MPVAPRRALLLVLAALAAALAAPGAADASVVARLRAPVDALAADGAFVAVATRPTRAACARVWLLAPRRRPAALSPLAGLTCAASRARRARVVGVALAGRRAAWLVQGPGVAGRAPDSELDATSAVLVAGAVGRAEAILADAGAAEGATRRIVGPRGSGAVIGWTVRGSYAAGGDDCGADDPDATCAVDFSDVAVDVGAGVDAARLLAVDGRRLLVEVDGALRVTALDGTPAGALAAPVAARGDLSGTRAVVLRAGRPTTLEVYDVASGALVATRRLVGRIQSGPALAGTLVAYRTGRALRVLDLARGRDRAVARLPRGALARGFELTPAGLVWAYDRRGRGVVERMAASRVAAALARR